MIVIPDTALTNNGIIHPVCIIVKTIQDTPAMLAAMYIATLTVFSRPITIGIVFRPAALSPWTSATSLKGEVMNTIPPSIEAIYIVSKIGLYGIFELVVTFNDHNDVAPSVIHSIIATAIASVFTTKRSLSEIFGAEYMIPIDTNPREIKTPIISLPIKQNNIPKVFVMITNTHA